jgi:hypothetical protein
MRPIFTGATDKSNLQHDISFWIKKFPYVERLRVAPNLVNEANNIASNPDSYVWTSYHGTKLRCNQDGSVDLAPHAREWEQWARIRIGVNKCVWRSCHGTYLRANDDGTVDAAPHAREWEEWTIVKHPLGNVLRSYHGTYLSAGNDGSVTTMPHIKWWELWRFRATS